jgi:hypothetical protein
MSKAQETADALRGEAKRMLCSAIGIPPDVGSEAVNLAVDCIIGAAILEAVIVINEGAKKHENRLSQPKTS